MFLKLIIFLAIFQPSEFTPLIFHGQFQGHKISTQKPDEVTRLLSEIQSSNARTQTRAERRLLLLGRKSDTLRNRIVRELIEILNKSSLRNKILSSEQFDSFRSIVEILGELRATEALDTLIACLDCNNGTYGESASRFPATIALAKIGEPAIPSLSKALSDEWVGTRALAAQTLGMIGGDRARQVLEHALTTEKDEQVLGGIRIALNSISRKSN